jgi:hypothetical protein
MLIIAKNLSTVNSILLKYKKKIIQSIIFLLYFNNYYQNTNIVG